MRLTLFADPLFLNVFPACLCWNDGAASHRSIEPWRSVTRGCNSMLYRVSALVLFAGHVI